MIRLFPKPKDIIEYGGEYYFSKNVMLTISKKYYDVDQIGLFRELFTNFTAGIGKLKVVLRDDDIRTVTISEQVCKTTNTELGEYDYVLKIDDSGVQLHFWDKASLSRAFCTMLSIVEIRSSLERNKEIFTLPKCCISDKAEIEVRSIHFCVFSETKYKMMKKFVRFACFAKYNQIVIEFWGTYPYRCVKEMSRAKYAYKLSQIKNIIKDAKGFGVEIIPMLNVLGHAAQNRAMYAKHTTLDQNPLLGEIFEPDGWTWNILNPKTVIIVHSMIDELCETFQGCKHFHIGCDESFPYGSSRLFEGKDKTDVMIDYINTITARLKSKGITPIMWGDQLLYNPEWPATIYAYGESKQSTDKLLEKLDKDIIIADWQYEAKDDVIPTSKVLSNAGFRVMLAPWGGNKYNCAKNVREQNYLGYMQTTWDDMSSSVGLILEGADQAWRGGVDYYPKIDSEFMLFESISYMRRLSPPKGDFKFSGIRENEIIV